MPGMTLMEIKYALVSPLTSEQLRQLGEFANTYGLRKFRLNEINLTIVGSSQSTHGFLLEV